MDICNAERVGVGMQLSADFPRRRVKERRSRQSRYSGSNGYLNKHIRTVQFYDAVFLPSPLTSLPRRARGVGSLSPGREGRGEGGELNNPDKRIMLSKGGGL